MKVYITFVIIFNMFKNEFKISTKLEELDNIIKKIAKINGVIAIYLFGSQVTGRIHTFSDIDLCVILDKPNDETELDILGFSSDNLDVSTFHRLPIVIQYRIFKDGHPLFVKNKNLLARIKLYTLRNYLDFKPHLDRLCREALNVR